MFSGLYILYYELHFLAGMVRGARGNGCYAIMSACNGYLEGKSKWVANDPPEIQHGPSVSSLGPQLVMSLRHLHPKRGNALRDEPAP